MTRRKKVIFALVAIALASVFATPVIYLAYDVISVEHYRMQTWLMRVGGGLAIVPDTSSGMSRTMLFPNLNSGDTRIAVYYRNSEKDSIIANFPFVGSPGPGGSAHANYFTRNYTGTEVANHINTSKPGATTSSE